MDVYCTDLNVPAGSSRRGFFTLLGSSPLGLPKSQAVKRIKEKKRKEKKKDKKWKLISEVRKKIIKSCS